MARSEATVSADDRRFLERFEAVVPLAELKADAKLEELKAELGITSAVPAQVTEVEGVAEVASAGGHVRQYQIEVDPENPRWITTVWGVGYRFDEGEAP